MVDLREKNTNNLESEQQIELNETNINLEETNVNTNSTNIEVSTESDINVENNIEDSNNDISNCLALTVKKDYNLTIVKNVFTTTGRLSWKIALVTAIINILNMLF